MQNIVIEFYGVPRIRTGQATAVLTFDPAVPVSLHDVSRALIDRFPALSGDCITHDGPTDGYVFCIDGKHFVRERSHRIDASQTLLFISADAGG
ncbi:MAG TPA: hypothetical protein DCY79_04455 [Planctomycetaceae bacterium]|nr:hypothetical protein [Blastopirellula sp.]HAY79038.1 hypothetical protein [Planctomycetaceae bacterium]